MAFSAENISKNSVNANPAPGGSAPKVMKIRIEEREAKRFLPLASCRFESVRDAGTLAHMEETFPVMETAVTFQKLPIKRQRRKLKAIFRKNN